MNRMPIRQDEGGQNTALAIEVVTTENRRNKENSGWR